MMKSAKKVSLIFLFKLLKYFLGRFEDLMIIHAQKVRGDWQVGRGTG